MYGLHSGDLRDDVMTCLLFWFEVSHHLSCGHADSLGGELASTHVEEVFQAGTEEVDDQNIM